MKPGTFLLSAILLAASAAAQDSETSSIVIIGDRLIDATGAGINEDYAVVIQGERIAEVGPKDRVRIPLGAEVIDVSGATVLPGLADVHVHPAFYLAGPRDFEDDSLSALRASAILRQALDAGITLMRDLGARHNVGIGLKHALAKGYIEGPRLIVANGVVGQTGAHAAEFELMVPPKWLLASDSPGEWRKHIRENFKLGADVTKVTSPFTREEIEIAVEETHNLGAMIAVHAGGRKGGKPVSPNWYSDPEMMMVEWAVAAGADTIEHLYPMKNQATVIAMMSKKGTIVVPTIRGIGRSTREPTESDIRFQLTPAHAEDRFRKLHEAGVPMAIATDVEGGRQGEIGNYYIQELEQFIEWGYSPQEAIEAATRVGAMACGLADSVGTLEAGKLADLIVVPGNPLENIKVLTRPILVIQGGKVVRDRRSTDSMRNVTP